MKAEVGHFSDEQRAALNTAANTLALLCDHCVRFKGEHARDGDVSRCTVGSGTFTAHAEAAVLRAMMDGSAVLRVEVEANDVASDGRIKPPEVTKLRNSATEALRAGVREATMPATTLDVLSAAIARKTADELAAAKAMLEAAGYTVAPPPCAECGGTGFVNEGGPGYHRSRACSRGCRLVRYNGGIARAPHVAKAEPKPYAGQREGAVVEARAAGARTHPL